MQAREGHGAARGRGWRRLVPKGRRGARTDGGRQEGRGRWRAQRRDGRAALAQGGGRGGASELVEGTRRGSERGAGSRARHPPRPAVRTNRTYTTAMPKAISEIKDFLLTARRRDASRVRIKKSGDITKFKVRCSRYLYTLCVTDSDKAEKLRQSLPPGLNVEDL